MKHKRQWHNVQMSVIYPASGISGWSGWPMLKHDRTPVLPTDELVCLIHEGKEFPTFPFGEVTQGHHVSARDYQKPTLYEGTD